MTSHAINLWGHEFVDAVLLSGLLWWQLALVILMVTGIHFIEAYGLNPAIYSAHLKLHPLLVLTVLVVAEHSLGVWGLLLAGEIIWPMPNFFRSSGHPIRCLFYAGAGDF